MPTMKKIISTLLGLTGICGFAIIPQFPSAIAMPIAKTTDFTRQPPIGALGQPLGKVTTISGVIRQAALGAKASKLDLVLSIEAVNNRPLPKPVTMPFQIFETAKVVQPFLGQTFRYVGYETGGFTGVPAEAFNWVLAVSSREYHFAAFYEILHEDLQQVKTKADLIRSNNQRVQIVGKYVATPKQRPTSANANVVAPNTGEPILQASYATVNIELADGTLVPLFSPLNKLSNRLAEEVQSFDGKLVSIVGLLAHQPIDSGVKPKSTIAIVRMDRIELDQAR
jgi:hypothetical protein